jgi:hypothetical protein
MENTVPITQFSSGSK